MIIAIFGFLATVTGCCCGGGTDTVVVEKQVAAPPASAPPASAPPVSVGDELLKLNETKEKGIITEEEFETQKKKVLEAK